MSVTYTPNLGLGLQLDKTEYLNWDVITENWQKIDDASAGGGGGGGVPIGNTVMLQRGIIGGFTGIFDRPNRAFIRATGEQGIDCQFTPDDTIRNVKYEIEFADFRCPSSGWGAMHGGWNLNSGGSLAPAMWEINAADSRSYGKPLLRVGYALLFANQCLPTSGFHKYVTTISGKYVTVNVDEEIELEVNWADNYGGGINVPVALCCNVWVSGDSQYLNEFGILDVYSFKIYESGVLVRDFVPALGANDRPAFFDNVSQTYFYSETGTDFIYVPAEMEG